MILYSVQLSMSSKQWQFSNYNVDEKYTRKISSNKNNQTIFKMIYEYIVQRIL